MFERMKLDVSNQADGPDNCVSLEIRIGTWNLAGLSPHDCDLLIEQLSDNYKWDVVLLQETFVCADGVELESKHVISSASVSDGDCRLPSVLVHEKWASSSRVVGEGPVGSP